MRKPIVTALAVILTLAIAAGVARAEEGLEFDDSTATLTFSSLTFSGGLGVDIVCSLTLDVTLHESVAKTAGALAGFADITVSTGRCSEGNIGLLSGRSRVTEVRNFHLTYSSFSGTLPSISAVSLMINDVTLWIQNGSIECLTEGPQDILGTTTGGNPASGLSISAAGIGLDADFPCDFSSGSLSGEGSFDESIGITLGGSEGPDPADLGASPASVVIDELESSDTFTLRNSGGSTATIDSVEDERATQFDVSGCGEGRTIRVEASCVYTIEVDERPLASGRVTVTYDDGAGGTRRVSVEVDIAGVDSEAVLEADPAAVTIEALEQNDIVEIRNVGGGNTAVIDRITTTTTDTESPEFTVITTGCRETLRVDEACHYLISVNSRPEASGSITVEYDDDGGSGENRRLVIEVDIEGPDPAELEADPTEVVIESLESNDSFVIRNISPDTAAVINRAILTSDDTERPEFSVTGIGCPEIYLAGASCTYVVAVNSRPEADGRYAIEYDDGAGNDRTVTVNIDIAS